MAIPKFEDDLRIISKLGDNPGSDNGLSTKAFREKFDEAALIVQKFINDKIIPELGARNSPEDGLSMKGNIAMGKNRITDLGKPTFENDAATKSYVDEKMSTAICVLKKEYWVDNTQEITVNGVTSDVTKSDVIAAPDPADVNYTAFNENGVRVISQMNNAIKFKCESVPQNDLTVHVMVFHKGG